MPDLEGATKLNGLRPQRKLNAEDAAAVLFRIVVGSGIMDRTDSGSHL
jgi:hypothetical protein